MLRNFTEIFGRLQQEAEVAETPTNGATPPSGGDLLNNSEPDIKTQQAEIAKDTPTVDVPEWKQALPEEIRDAASLKMIHDVESLAKGYVNAQKLVGVDKIPVPGKNATEGEWRDVFHKIGLPDTLDDYKLDLDPEMAEAVDKDQLAKLKEVAFKNNILPHQLKGILEHYRETESALMEQTQEAAEKQQQEAVENLRKEWGMAFEAKAELASNVLREHADEKDWQFLKDTGLTNSPELTRVMAKIGQKLYGEAEIKGEGGRANGILSPEEAQAEIARRQGSKAYIDANHPNHAQEVKDIQRLYKMAYPE